MDDRPHGPELLALARDVLVNDLIPLLPQERRLDALLVANCMAIAAREAEAAGPDDMVRCDLAVFYPDEKNDGASLRRFARELRIGAFENSPEREVLAHAMLWRMTIARLRLANPRFLAANGFA